MSKKLSYKGILPVGEQAEINLRTINGKVGYKIVKFRILGNKPGVGNSEYVGQVFKTDQDGSITNFVDFSNSDLLAVSYHKEGSGTAESFETISVLSPIPFLNVSIFSILGVIISSKL